MELAQKFYNNNSKDLGLDTTFDDFLDIIRGK